METWDTTKFLISRGNFYQPFPVNRQNACYLLINCLYSMQKIREEELFMALGYKEQKCKECKRLAVLEVLERERRPNSITEIRVKCNLCKAEYWITED